VRRAEQAVQVARRDRKTARVLGDARVSGCGEEETDRGVAGEAPGERVLAGAAADEERLHRGHPGL